MENYKKIVSFIKSLDKESKVIVFYCWRNDWVTIRELSYIIAARNDSYTLFKIKEVINAESTKVLGKPALVFKERAVDPVTKKLVTFAWWFNFQTRKNETLRIRVNA
ncbi:MAG: hypothetical protein Q8N63_05950 [Nanoarchaeota archaeon]|nr:hypothetical protein [Nanoarchaeota archaeon]